MRSARTPNRIRDTQKADITRSVEAGSGNVFADVGLPRPELALAKAKLVRRIRDLIGEKKLTQFKAAELLGLDQPKVSALVRGKVAGYSLDRLIRYLNALGQRVEITVRQSGNGATRAEKVVVVG
jgi:predicted XRE-type DNA-binding protein